MKNLLVTENEKKGSLVKIYAVMSCKHEIDNIRVKLDIVLIFGKSVDNLKSIFSLSNIASYISIS